MSNRKTPRTLIGGYLDAAKTQQTIHPVRQKRAVTRSPVTKSPRQQPSLKHDRVASLKKRTRSQSISTSVTEEDTPRQLIEGFIDGNDSTIPLARLKQRTSQTGVSSSALAGSVARRALSVSTHGQRSSLSEDLETPRTLLQKFLQNVTAVDDTPLAARQTHGSVQRTPTEVPSSQDSGSYSTPSPFKASSRESVVSEQSATRRQTPRTRTPGKFSVIVPDTQEARDETGDFDISSSLSEDVVPASQTYEDPSLLSSSSSESDIFNSPKQTQSQKPPRQGRFSVAAPQHLVDEYAARRRNTLADDSDEADSDSQDIGADGYSGEDVAPAQEPYHMYELPLKPSDGRGHSPGDMSEPVDGGGHVVDETAEPEVHVRSYSRSGIVDSLADLHHYNKTGVSEEDYSPDVSSIQRYGVSETIRSSQDVHDQMPEIDTHDQISEIGSQSSHGTEEPRRGDGERRGRWSEGHQSQYNSPRSQTDRRLSEGHHYVGRDHLSTNPGRASSMPLEGQLQSPRSMKSNVSYNRSPQESSRSFKGHVESPRSVSSNTSYRGSRRQQSLPLESPESPSSNRSGRISQGHASRSHQIGQSSSVDGVSSQQQLEHPSSPHSESGAGDNLHRHGSGSYVAFDLGQSVSANTDHIHTMPNMTTNFSPRITSTQNPDNFNSSYNQDSLSSTGSRDNLVNSSHNLDGRSSHSYQDNLASPVRTPDELSSLHNTDNLASSPTSHLDHVSPSPRLSPSSQRLSSSRQMSSSPRLSTSSQRLSSASQRMSSSLRLSSSPRLSTPSERLSPSNQRLSTASQQLSSSSLRLSTPSQRIHSASQRLSNQTLSGNQRLSSSGHILYTTEGVVGADSPLATVTPSPVVSPLDPPTPRTGSVGRVSTRSSTGSSRARRSSGGSVRDVSTRSSSGSVGPMSAGSVRQMSKRPSTGAGEPMAKRRRSSDLVHTLPNSSARFSPEAMSTQKPLEDDSPGQSPLDTVSPSPRVSPDGVPPQPSGHPHMDTDKGRQSGPDNDRTGDEDAIEATNGASDKNVLQPPQNPPKRAARQPRKKAIYSMPVSLVKKQFNHFAGLRVSKEAIEEVMKVSERYWDHLATDLEAYARHAGRKTINMADFVLLFKRQGLVDEKQSLHSLIEKYLPMEEREKLIHVARSGNRIEPKV